MLRGTTALDRAALAAAFALTLVAVIPAAIGALWDADVWWILRAGIETLREHRVAHVNRYGFTASTHPWVMHEWGFGVLYAALVARGGLGALALVRVAVVASVVGAVAWRSLRDARPWIAALCVALAVAVFGGRFESPRPVGMTWALAVALAAVVFEPAFAWRHVAIVAALMLAWSNLHGSFPLGVALCALGLTVPGGDRRARVAALALAASATFATPYGLTLHRLALRYALGQGGDAVAVVHARIVEWWPLWRAPPSPVEGVAAVALTALWIDSLRDPRWRGRALVGIALVGMALRHARHLQLAGMVGTVLAAGPLEARVARYAGPSKRLPARLALAWCVATTVVGVGLWAMATPGRAAGDWIDGSRQDEALDAALGALPAEAQVFAELPFTGYAVWRGRRVFFDARNDCYPAAVLRLAYDINDGRLPPAQAVAALRHYGTTHAIVRCGSSASRSFATATQASARDGVCVYALSPATDAREP